MVKISEVIDLKNDLFISLQPLPECFQTFLFLFWDQCGAN